MDGCWIDVGWMEVGWLDGWLEKAELKPTTNSAQFSWSLDTSVKANIIKIHISCKINFIGWMDG